MHNILIVEDHPMMQDAIKASIQGLPFKARVLTANVLAELTSHAWLAALKTPSLIVADLNLPDSQGLATLVSLRSQFPHTPILIFSQIDDPKVELQVLALGAAGFVSKSHPPKVFIERIRAMVSSLQQHMPIAIQVTSTLETQDDDAFDDKHPINTLTMQQRKVLKLLALGKSSQEIAAQLEITEPTVRTHLTEIYRRVGVKNRTQAIVLYLKWAGEYEH